MHRKQSCVSARAVLARLKLVWGFGRHLNLQEGRSFWKTCRNWKIHLILLQLYAVGPDKETKYKCKYRWTWHFMLLWRRETTFTSLNEILVVSESDQLLVSHVFNTPSSLKVRRSKGSSFMCSQTIWIIICWK